MNNYNINISEYRILLDDNELNDDIINFLLYDTDNEGILESKLTKKFKKIKYEKTILKNDDQQKNNNKYDIYTTVIEDFLYVFKSNILKLFETTN
jgi:hypothetical protein